MQRKHVQQKHATAGFVMRPGRLRAPELTGTVPCSAQIICSASSASSSSAVSSYTVFSTAAMIGRSGHISCQRRRTTGDLRGRGVYSDAHDEARAVSGGQYTQSSGSTQTALKFPAWSRR